MARGCTATKRPVASGAFKLQLVSCTKLRGQLSSQNQQSSVRKITLLSATRVSCSTVSPVENAGMILNHVRTLAALPL
jgi:hypothetical protein